MIISVMKPIIMIANRSRSRRCKPSVLFVDCKLWYALESAAYWTTYWQMSHGQKFDVVVVNFVNVKMRLMLGYMNYWKKSSNYFDGVFGQVRRGVGAIGNGVDFENASTQIYYECRDERSHKEAFWCLQEEWSQASAIKFKAYEQPY